MKSSIKQGRIVALFASFFIFATGTSFAGEDLDRVVKDKVLKVATDSNWAPQSFLNDKNEMDGFDVDVAKAIAEKLGAKAEFVTPAWDIITAGNWNNRWDISVGSMTPTKERTKVLSFPAVYYFTPASFAVHNDSKATKVSDLDGKVLGATTTSTYQRYMEKDLIIDAEGAPAFEYQVTPGKINTFESSTVGFDSLRLGDGVRYSAVLSSLPSIQEAIKNKYPLKVLGDPVFYEPLAAAIDKGDDEFAAKLKEIIEGLHADGTLKTLSTKWYGVDYSSVSK